MSIEQLTLNPSRLVVVTGSPGVGKTTLIDELSKHIFNCQTIKKDDIAQQITGSDRGPNYVSKYREGVYAMLYQKTEMVLSDGVTVIDEVTHRDDILKPNWYFRYAEIADKHQAYLRIIRLVTSEETLYTRLKRRNLPQDADKLTPEGWIAFLKREPIDVDTLPPDISRRIICNGDLAETVDQALAFIKS